MHLEYWMDRLHLAYRQKAAFYAARSLVRNFPWQRWLSSLVLLCELLGCVVLDTPYTPHGQALDLRDYALVMVDEFEGEALDESVWLCRSAGPRRGGYQAASQIDVHDGNLYITGEYRENGTYGAGWYAGAVSLRERYTNGYFEIRCKCSKGTGFWSAFWLQSPVAYDHLRSKGGIGGAEIDIFEAMRAKAPTKRGQNCVTTTIHCNGWDNDEEHIDSRMLGDFYVHDIYDEYNTYGLEWTQDEYIFYINGVESCRSSFGKGVSTTPEEVIVSLELPEADALRFAHDHKTQFIVDYVKIYQKTPIAG